LQFPTLLLAPWQKLIQEKLAVLFPCRQDGAASFFFFAVQDAVAFDAAFLIVITPSLTECPLDQQTSPS